MKTFFAFFFGIMSISFAQPVNPSDREGLLNGEGMGLASLAEMNGYPGPKHVLELKDQLGLTQDQVLKTETIMKGVEVSAKLAGADIVRLEEELHKLFENGKITEKTLRARVERIGSLRGRLRFIHMQAHLKMKSILSENQIQMYSELRGHASH
ncbi:MAG: hypothetical protein HYY49_12300 [Ignavibacteriales bacterium]|nr:hypothetical protein [Ignavibacteriales bacterium]